MAVHYVDFDVAAGDDSGDSCTNAKATLEGGIGLMSAGDTLFVQGVVDTVTVSTTLGLTAGTLSNPLIIRGVQDGVSAEPPLTTNLAVRGTHTLPKFSCRGGGGSDDITLNGVADWFGMEIDGTGDIFASNDDYSKFTGCKITFDEILAGLNGGVIRAEDCEIRYLLVGATLKSTAESQRNSPGVYVDGGELSFVTAPTNLVHADTTGSIELNGVDITGAGTVTVWDPATACGDVKLRNCSMPGTFTHVSGVPSHTHPPFFFYESVDSTGDTSVANTSSINDYYSQSLWGTVESEFTKTRTDGANDGAKGAFAYKMTPLSSTVLESTFANLASPWLRVWTAGGSSETFTVHIANDGAGDLLEDEVWAEFYSVDGGDTAEHDLAFVGETTAPGRMLPSSVAVTDDGDSNWGGSVGNHQKMSVTVTPGFEGWVYARVYYAKRTFDVMYLDPKIVVT